MAVFNLWLAKILILLEWFIFHSTGRKGKCSQETRCVLLALLDIQHLCFPGFASQQRRHQQKTARWWDFRAPFDGLPVCHLKMVDRYTKKGDVPRLWLWTCDGEVGFWMPTQGSVALAILNWRPQKQRYGWWLTWHSMHACILYVIYHIYYIFH